MKWVSINELCNVRIVHIAYMYCIFDRSLPSIIRYPMTDVENKWQKDHVRDEHDIDAQHITQKHLSDVLTSISQLNCNTNTWCIQSIIRNCRRSDIACDRMHKFSVAAKCPLQLNRKPFFRSYVKWWICMHCIYIEMFHIFFPPIFTTCRMQCSYAI